MRFYQLKETNYGSLVDKTTYKSLDSADKALYTYTADGFTSLDSHIGKLISKYPFGGGVLYRGLHFEDAESYQDFMSFISDGTMTVNSCTSWTPDLGTAADFAKSKKSYFPTPELIAASRQRTTTGDHMSGYSGVVLMTTVAANRGCDVAMSEFAKESEVILPPGEYSVVVHKELIPFAREYDTRDKVATLIKNLRDGSVEATKAIIEYVEKSIVPIADKDEIDIIAKLIFPKMFAPGVEDAIRTNVRENSKVEKAWIDKSHRAILSVTVPFHSALITKGNPPLIARAKKLAKIAIDEATLIVDELMDEIKNKNAIELEIHGREDLEELGMRHELDAITASFRSYLGGKYHEMNSRENNKKLNTTDAIKNHAKDIEALLKSMLKT